MSREWEIPRSISICSRQSSKVSATESPVSSAARSAWALTAGIVLEASFLARAMASSPAAAV